MYSTLLVVNLRTHARKQNNACFLSPSLALTIHSPSISSLQAQVHSPACLFLVHSVALCTCALVLWLCVSSVFGSRALVWSREEEEYIGRKPLWSLAVNNSNFSGFQICTCFPNIGREGYSKYQPFAVLYFLTYRYLVLSLTIPYHGI